MTGVSRRVVLLGGVGLAVSACTADAATRQRATTLVTGQFDSAARKTSVGWALAYPTGHEDAKLPVVISLHGRGGTHRNTFDRLRLDEVLDRVVAAGVPPFAVASVDGGDHSYYHPRADGTDASAMVREEFVPLLARRGLDTDRIGLFGWSMGGYGALRLAGKEHFPVRGVAVSSPALFTAAASAATGAYDSPEDYARNDVFGNPAWLDGEHLRIDCGKQDPFYAATRDFVGRLQPAPAGGFRSGGHRVAYWRSVAPAQLRFLGNALA